MYFLGHFCMYFINALYCKIDFFKPLKVEGHMQNSYKIIDMATSNKDRTMYVVSSA